MSFSDFLQSLFFHTTVQQANNDFVMFSGFQFLRCYKNCRASDDKPEMDGISHYHCNVCPAIHKRQEGFKNHLRKHDVVTASDTIGEDGSLSTQVEALSDVASINEDSATLEKDESSNYCNACSKYFASKKSLQNHTKYYHVSPDFINATRYLNGVCVDPDRGIYMIRRSFSGTSHPVHVMHNFGSDGGFSCELNDCREISNTAKRSGNPNFVCNHLKSVQYVTKNSTSRYILPRESLEELISKKISWLKQSRQEECLKLQQNASKDKVPIITEYSVSNSATSTRYQHYSVYDGNVHHYSRFKRVIVSYDRAENKWTCSCCRLKVNCVHKCVAKWFMYAERPHDLLLNNRDSESDDEITEGSKTPRSETEYSVTGTSYPPKEAALKKLVKYLHSCKRIPLKLPREITHDVEGYPTRLVPAEEKCFFCKDVELSEAKQITGKGKIFRTTGVIEG